MWTRKSRDCISRLAVTLVGYSVLLAFAMIFIFLLWQVWPLFQPAKISAQPGSSASGAMSFSYSIDGESSTPDSSSLWLDNGWDERVLLQADGYFRWYLRVGDDWQLQLQGKLGLTSWQAATMLTGSRTLLVADQYAQVHSWFRLHQELIARPGIALRQAELRALIPVSADSFFSLHPGHLHWYHATTGTRLAELRLPATPLQHLHLSEDRQRMRLDWASGHSKAYQLQWQHPAVAGGQLWSAVHYEGRREAAYVWQTAAAADDSNPRLSLVPLTSGTLKAAGYAMLFATPLAILAAVFTAFYLPERWRYRTRATMEMLESMPTVILGFIAAFLLAPWLEQQLMLFFVLLVLVPSVLVLCSGLWFHWRQRQQQQAEQPGALLVLSLVASILMAFMLAPALEHAWFDGSLLLWLASQGMDYQQRNALIIGMAMGLAVIPCIFSLTEEVVSQVPSSLTQGVLALGASRWQTLSSMVLPVAAPGILAAVLLGLGRALGETMILIMATGNTPLLGFDPFEGMRTLTASLALEIPEAAVGSSHLKVLLLAALLLLVLTFLVNTLVSVLRQRIRQRYQQL
ncbi:ABC transporter permease subunit [Alkalimonas amylolytica]|uniref:Binding-protein-dependent transport system inner membrane component n=1 Tax=Alkalimonas amylolytica TaxID=152573 RepID=A0A1H4E315_ALKAM|nr:ABC transporter permease subunit [Alkalimonas amylolytica]SEA78792.1 Binding-protein-dependent transport system inner membrane component [Alkalimonas amylolytica]